MQPQAKGSLWRRWWREAEGFQGRFAVIFPIDSENVTFVANAPLRELHKHGLPFNPGRPRSVQADLAHADNLQRCLTVFHDFDERLLKVSLLRAQPARGAACAVPVCAGLDMHSQSPGCCSQAPYAVQVLRETDPSSVTEHGLYERPVDKMPDEVRVPLCINEQCLQHVRSTALNHAQWSGRQ